MRGRYGTERWTRPPSSAAAAQLYSQLENFAGIVSQASKSDALVRTKFGQWESKIELLGGDEVSERISPLEARPSKLMRLLDRTHWNALYLE